MGADEEMMKALEDANQPNSPIENGMSAQAYQKIQSQEDNLIVWQLELDNILERIEHLLRGDVLKRDEHGNYDFQVPEDKNLIILNDYGVQMIMNFISFYLNRNTILSNYKEERIYEILFDLGYELSDMVYINYEKMGLDTVEKRSRSSPLIMNILHMLESSYNRALHGEERDSLRKARIVTQHQPLSQDGNNNGNSSGFTMNPIKRILGG